MTDIIMHGIASCDTVKKAKVWLQQADVAFAFRDYKKQPPELAELQVWSQQVGWETLLNKRGTTWRKLDPSLQADLDEAKALQLLVQNPSMIKRPVLVRGKRIEVGFKADQYHTFLA